MRYNRALLPARNDEPHIVAELQRREHGPICAQCQFSPLDERDLPPLVAGDDVPLVGKRGFERTFVCEARSRSCSADSGNGCRHFQRRV